MSKIDDGGPIFEFFERGGVMWQPISSAPRDGTRILTWSGSHGVEVAQWTWNEKWEIFATAEYDNDWAILEGVTHWQPLPAPPEEEQN